MRGNCQIPQMMVMRQNPVQNQAAHNSQSDDSKWSLIPRRFGAVTDKMNLIRLNVDGSATAIQDVAA